MSDGAVKGMIKVHPDLAPLPAGHMYSIRDEMDYGQRRLSVEILDEFGTVRAESWMPEHLTGAGWGVVTTIRSEIIWVANSLANSLWMELQSPIADLIGVHPSAATS